MQVEILSRSEQASSTLINLVRRCVTMDWAVAWATESVVTTTAWEHRTKFRRFVVGTHQYITSPRIIEQFLSLSNFRVQMPTGALFHPKVYCFDLGEEVAVVVGSHNLTGNAFSSNQEASVLLSSGRGSPELAQLANLVADYWQSAVVPTQEWLYGYEVNHRRAMRLAKDAERWIEVKPPKEATGRPGPQDMDWPMYVSLVTQDKHHPEEGRLRVLAEAARLFRAAPTFSQLPVHDRRRIAGTLGRRQSIEGDLDWAWFGSMGASPSFNTTVTENPEGLSRALEAIPSVGPVSKSDYSQFVDQFMGAFSLDLRAGGGIGTGTRLLAMKRPDQFLCLNGANHKGICTDFGQAANTTKLENYWERIIEPMRETRWWQADRPPSPGLEQRIWDARAAMFDVVHYEPRT